MVFRWSKQT